MPKKLSRMNFEQAVHYLQTYGRPLEQQLFQHEFYGPSPQPLLEAAPRPDTPWSQALDPAELQANLDELIERQLDDGSWPLTWSWDFIDAQAWAQAERDWKGLLIFNHLSSLKAYDRLG